MVIDEQSLWCRYIRLSFFSDETEIKFDENLHIEFDIEKTRAAEPNRGEFRIYNLSENTRNQLKRRSLDRTKGEFTRVRLVGGYKPTENITPNNVLFDGYIRRVYSGRESADIVTAIEAYDGDIDYRNAVVNSSFAAGTPYADIIDYIRDQMPNVGAGNLSGLAQMGVTDKGYTISGWAKRYLDEICRKFDCRWSIQNGALEILSDDEGIERNVPLIRPSRMDDNGNRIGGSMILSPYVTETGISVTTLLNASIRPNTLVTVESTFRDGSDVNAISSEIEAGGTRVYRVNNVRYHGSNFDVEYYTTAECQSADGFEVVRAVNNGGDVSGG